MAMLTSARARLAVRLGAATLFLLASGLAALSDDSPMRAVITEKRNKVERRASERTDWFAAQVQDILLVDNAVRTGANAMAQLTYGDGAVTRLAPNTTMVIKQQESRIFNILLGKIWMRLNKGNAKTRLKSPSAIATVIGTTVYVEVAPVGTRPGSGEPGGPVSWRTPGRLLALAPQLLVGLYAQDTGTDIQTQTTFVVLDTEGAHQLEVQSLDPLTGQPLGNPVTLGNSMGVVIEPGQPAPPPQPMNVDTVITRNNASGFIPQGQQAGQPTGTTGQTGPDANAAQPSPGVSFNPTQDAPVLPSQELDRTGSDVTGRVNVIIEHDGPPR